MPIAIIEWATLVSIQLVSPIKGERGPMYDKIKNTSKVSIQLVSPIKGELAVKLGSGGTLKVSIQLVSPIKGEL